MKRKKIEIHTSLRLSYCSRNLLELPDLVLTTPFTQQSNGGTEDDTTLVGVNVLVGLLDDDAAIRL